MLGADGPLDERGRGGRREPGADAEQAARARAAANAVVRQVGGRGDMVKGSIDAKDWGSGGNAPSGDEGGCEARRDTICRAT